MGKLSISCCSIRERCNGHIFCIMLAIMMFPVLISCATVPVKEAPRAEDFIGKWSGKWDNTWPVQFTITENADTKEISVLYEWEENLGQKMQTRTYRGKLAKNALMVGDLIELSISANSPDQGQAYGRFREVRTAILTRDRSVLPKNQ